MCDRGLRRVLMVVHEAEEDSSCMRGCVWLCARVFVCACVCVSEGVFVYMHSDACYWAFVAICGVPALLSYILFISNLLCCAPAHFFSLRIFFCLARMSSAETETLGRLSCSCPASTAPAAIPMCIPVRFCRCLHHDGLWLLCKKKNNSTKCYEL